MQPPLLSLSPLVRGDLKYRNETSRLEMTDEHVSDLNWVQLHSNLDYIFF